MRISSIFALLILLSLCGCRQTATQRYAYPDFPHIHPVTPNVISEPLVLPNLIYDFEVTEDYFIVLCFYENQWLHIFDKKSGEYINSALTHGRGPGEIMTATEFSMDKSRENFLIFDEVAKVLFTVNVDSLVHNTLRPAIYKNSNFDSPRTRGVYPLEYDILVFKAALPRVSDDPSHYFRFSGDRIGAQYTDYPVDDPTLAFYLFVDFKQTISPDQTKTAAGTTYGAILESFDISDGGIEPMSVTYISEPVLDGSRKMIDPYASGRGFADLYGTNNRLYSSFGGKKTSDMECYDIAIFDWKGNPLALHNTDYKLGKICVEPDDSVLYALGKDEEGYVRFLAFSLH